MRYLYQSPYTPRKKWWELLDWLECSKVENLVVVGLDRCGIGPYMVEARVLGWMESVVSAWGDISVPTLGRIVERTSIDTGRVYPKG